VTTQSAATATPVARTPIVFFFMARSSSPFNYFLRREFLDIPAHYFLAIIAPQQSRSSPRTKRWRRRTGLFLRRWKSRWFAPLLSERKRDTTLVDVKYDRTHSTYWYVIENADQFDPQEMSALPSKADMFRHDRDVGLCHDDSGFYVAPIGQLTCMTAICVGCELAPAVCPASPPRNRACDVLGATR
jgi:hypothetical protein